MFDNMDLISVIVPIYNCENYIGSCIESICHQTYTNLEIILVDDGSKDNSRFIAEDFAKKDKRIKVIVKENGGASSARNAGLDNALGSWIVFQDSDDILVQDAIEVLYNNVVKCDSDICVGSIDIQSESGLKDYTLPIDKDMCIINEREYWQFCYTNYTATVPWAKIYKKSLWENVRFREGFIHEDEEILSHILPLCNRIVLLKHKVCIQNCHEGSVMNITYSSKHLARSQFMLERLYYYLDKGYREYYMTAFGEGTRVILEAKNKIDFNQEPDARKEIKRLYREYRVLSRTLSRNETKLFQRIRLVLFRVNLDLYGFIRKKGMRKYRKID